MNSIKEISVATRFDNPDHRSISYICQVKTEPLYWFPNDQYIQIRMSDIDMYLTRNMNKEFLSRVIENIPDEDFCPPWYPI